MATCYVLLDAFKKKKHHAFINVSLCNQHCGKLTANMKLFTIKY